MPVSRRALTFMVAGVVAVATGAGLATRILTDEKAQPSADRLRCPALFVPHIRQGAEAVPTFAEAPADSTAVVLCAQAGPGELQREPLAATAQPDAVQRLVRALEGPLPKLPPSSRPEGCGSTLAHILVFLHPDGQQAYGVTRTETCSLMDDGKASILIPPEIAEFMPTA